MSKLTPCPDCGYQISKQAGMCPNCGRRVNFWLTIFAVVFWVGLALALSSGVVCGLIYIALNMH